MSRSKVSTCQRPCGSRGWTKPVPCFEGRLFHRWTTPAWRYPLQTVVGGAATTSESIRMDVRMWWASGEFFPRKARITSRPHAVGQWWRGTCASYASAVPYRFCLS